MPYIEPDLLTDETAVAEGSLAGIASQIPDWEPSEGHVETALSEAFGVAIATAMQAIIDNADNAYAGLTENVLNIVRLPATVASAESTWTLTDEAVTAGTTIWGGTEVQATTPDGTTVIFIVAEDVVVPAGTVAQAGVQLIALEAGSDANGAAGDADQSELADIASVFIDTAASGGTDEEELTDYLNRARDRATRLRALPITPQDYAALATDVTGVARAFVKNLYDPANPGVESTGHETIFGVDDAGQPLSALVKTALQSSFDTIERPLNVVTHIADPAYVDATVVIDVVAQPGADGDALEAAITTAVEAALDKAMWDADDTQPGGWVAVPASQLTNYQIAAVIDDLDDLRAITSITINGGDSLDLPDPLSLPNLVSLTVNVS